MQAVFSNLPISQTDKKLLNEGMDVKEIRRENLRALLNEFGTATALASAAGTDAAYLSQIKSTKTKREIGDNLARRLEKAANKDRGWMDQLHRQNGHKQRPASNKVNNAMEGGAFTRHEEAIIHIYRQLPPSGRKRFLDHVYAFATAFGVKVKRVA